MKYLTRRLGGGRVKGRAHGGDALFFPSFFSPGCMRLHAGRRSVCACDILSAFRPLFSIFHSLLSILYSVSSLSPA